ncbi:MAG: hypothetical protein COA79_25615 [Planctomycetota bacterium]|nr:MAG: hypothetical protein COA79_25615 [Planctomycetota bacterium]
MKKAVITGGTGCVGRNLVDILEKENWEIIVLHRESSDLSKLKGCNVKTQVVDLKNKTSVLNAIPFGLDAIFHVAANLSHDPRDQKEQWNDNVLGTRYLAEVALEKKTKRFIFTSTGATMTSHFKDKERCGKIKSGYVRTKRLAEIELYNKIKDGLDFVILHPIIVVGKYDYGNYSSIFKLLKEKKLKRIFPGNFVFCDATEIAKAHLNAYEKGKSCEHYVLGGVYSTWADFANTGGKILGLKKKIKPAPYIVLKIVSNIAFLYSKIVGNKIDMTPEVVELVGKGEVEINPYFSRKAKNEIGYDPEKQNLEGMIKTCINWMQISGKL